MASAFALAIFSGIGFLFGIQKSPVSYTHLDVYKRQRLTRLEGIGLSVLCAVLLVVLLFAPK